jgi:3',5'-cyclic AMP phosphodiesterase CpdA
MRRAIRNGLSMSFTIAHLSDAHLGPAPWPSLREMRLKRFMGYVNWKRGRERLSDMTMLARLVADLRAQAPDHVAMTGDVVNIGLPLEFRRAATWMRTLGESDDVSFTPGNHDAYVHDAMASLAEAFSPWTRGDTATEHRFPFLRVRRDVALIGLSSGVPTGPLMATGRLGARQIAELGRLLEETGARGLARVILIHHPPMSRGGAPLRGLTDARALEAVVARFGAEAILHGHTHRRMVHHLASPAPRPSPFRPIRASARRTTSFGWSARVRSGALPRAHAACCRGATRSANARRRRFRSAEGRSAPPKARGPTCPMPRRRPRRRAR